MRTDALTLMPSEWSLAAKKAVLTSLVCPFRISSPMMTMPASQESPVPLVVSGLLLELKFATLGAEEAAFPLSWAVAAAAYCVIVVSEIERM